MEKEDQYIVYINEEYKTRFYYKNDLLHREAGPAVIKGSEVKNYKHLVDNHPYKEIYIAKGPENYQSASLQHEGKLTWYAAEYYLEGQPYSPKDFEKIKAIRDLNNELSTELSVNDSKNKKAKM